MSWEMGAFGTRFDRASGVLLHPTSLPSGKLDSEAFRFIDWLAAAGQHWWQILPLAPPDTAGSPYAGLSAFAANARLLKGSAERVTAGDVEDFVSRNSYWAGGWARAAGPGALQDQVRFERQWNRVRVHAAERGVRILGDVPFYVARGSADHRDRPELFEVDQVAGVPPDDWSATGQLWNSPTYDWRAMRHEGYRWWIERFRRAFELVDALRIDHFRGFVAFWSVPIGARTAQGGRWRRGPGLELFQAVAVALGSLPLVAENLGLITSPVERLRHNLGLPGTIVLQFSFSSTLVNRPPRHVGVNEVVYTGTHDNDTATGWWRNARAEERERVDRSLRSLGIDDESQPHWKLVRLALRHPADVCILPAQDLLGLGSWARMNRPGRSRGNWAWRLEQGGLSRKLANRLFDETIASGRFSGSA